MPHMLQDKTFFFLFKTVSVTRQRSPDVDVVCAYTALLISKECYLPQREKIDLERGQAGGFLHEFAYE
jgi:hypothetical protein